MLEIPYLSFCLSSLFPSPTQRLTSKVPRSNTPAYLAEGKEIFCSMLTLSLQKKHLKPKKERKKRKRTNQNNKNHFVRLKGKVFDIIVSKVNLSCQSIICFDYKHIMICKWQWPTGGKANLDQGYLKVQVSHSAKRRENVSC